MTYPAMFLYKTVTAFNLELNLAPIITLLYSELKLIVQKCTWNHKYLCSLTGMMNVVGHKERNEVISLTAVLLKIQVFWNVTFVLLGKRFWMFRKITVPSSSGPSGQRIAWPWRWRQSDLSKHWELLTQ